MGPQTKPRIRTPEPETDEKKDGTATANAAAEPTTCGGATKAAESGCGSSVEVRQYA